jgi:hypothetical protein
MSAQRLQVLGHDLRIIKSNSADGDRSQSRVGALWLDA